LDTLILAISERPDTSYIGEGDEVQRHGENIIIDPELGTTTRPGVFAGGDAVTGPNMVVDAMAAGKIAADSIEKYIRGLPVQHDYSLTRPSVFAGPTEMTPEEAAKARRPRTPQLSLAQRKKSFKEVDLGLTERMACQEARRCLRCDLETEDGKNSLGAKK
jgi:NADH-quinone oxidoreductase subunit F